MIVTLQTQRVRTLEQVRAFVEGSEAVDFVEGDHLSLHRDGRHLKEFKAVSPVGKQLVARAPLPCHGP